MDRCLSTYTFDPFFCFFQRSVKNAVRIRPRTTPRRCFKVLRVRVRLPAEERRRLQEKRSLTRTGENAFVFRKKKQTKKKKPQQLVCPFVALQSGLTTCGETAKPFRTKDTISIVVAQSPKAKRANFPRGARHDCAERIVPLPLRPRPRPSLSHPSFTFYPSPWSFNPAQSACAWRANELTCVFIKFSTAPVQAVSQDRFPMNMTFGKAAFLPFFPRET